jgi:hypothetical protein
MLYSGSQELVLNRTRVLHRLDHLSRKAEDAGQLSVAAVPAALSLPPTVVRWSSRLGLRSAVPEPELAEARYLRCID